VQVYSLTGELHRTLRAVGELRCPAGLAAGAATTADADDALLFVSDRYNHRVLALSCGEGTVRLTLGEPGGGPGQLDWPLGIAVDGVHCFVCDAGQCAPVYSAHPSQAHTHGAAASPRSLATIGACDAGKAHACGSPWLQSRACAATGSPCIARGAAPLVGALAGRDRQQERCVHRSAWR
jgi:hypothetical protein